MGRKLKYTRILLTRTKNHNSYPILDNGISSFHHSYSNSDDRLHQHYLSEPSSLPRTHPNRLQNQVSDLDTIIETETKEQQESTTAITICQKDTCCR